jgi:hypothetical protein
MAWGFPHLAKNKRDAANFLYAALERSACAPFFFEEGRMKLREPTKYTGNRDVGHPAIGDGIEAKGAGSEFSRRP